MDSHSFSHSPPSPRTTPGSVQLLQEADPEKDPDVGERSRGKGPSGRREGGRVFRAVCVPSGHLRREWKGRGPRGRKDLGAQRGPASPASRNPAGLGDAQTRGAARGGTAGLTHRVSNHRNLGFYVPNFCEISWSSPLHVYSCCLRPGSQHLTLFWELYWVPSLCSVPICHQQSRLPCTKLSPSPPGELLIPI